MTVYALALSGNPVSILTIPTAQLPQPLNARIEERLGIRKLGKCALRSSDLAETAEWGGSRSNQPWLLAVATLLLTEPPSSSGCVLD